jgi:hypothetical protein
MICSPDGTMLHFSSENERSFGMLVHTCTCSLLHPVYFKARAFGKLARDIVPGVYAYVASG